MTPHSLPDINSSNTELDVDTIADELLQAFRERFEEGQTGTTKRIAGAMAPGRVNLIGDHTDYNDGFVLPVTIDRAVYVALRQRTDQTVRLRSLNFEDEVEYSLLDPPFSSLPGWARYAAGVAHELRDRDSIDVGFEGVIYGNVPLGSGLSSSAALEVAVALGLDALFGLNLDPISCARLCQKVEHTYVGVQCGIMDQMASRIGRAEHALFLDCRSLDYEHVPLPLDDTSIVIADTGVSRELASSKYNERRAECEESVAFFQQFDDRIEALRDVSIELFEEHGDKLSGPLDRRSKHVITENQRVLESAQLLKQGKVDAFGSLMNASHQSLRYDYEASSPELNVLVEAAQQCPGVYGARMTGAGFGGCAVCLVSESEIPTLQDRLTTHYVEEFDREPDVYVVNRNLEASQFSLT